MVMIAQYRVAGLFAYAETYQPLGDTCWRWDVGWGGKRFYSGVNETRDEAVRNAARTFCEMYRLHVAGGNRVENLYWGPWVPVEAREGTDSPSGEYLDPADDFRYETDPDDRQYDDCDIDVRDYDGNEVL